MNSENPMTRSRFLRAALLSTVGVLFSAAWGDARPQDGGKTPSIRWKRQAVRIEAAPEGFPMEVGPALEVWSDWAVAHRYRIDVDDSGRMLLVSPEGLGGMDKYLASASKVLALLDARLPRAPVAPSSSGGAPTAPPSSGGTLPEDPEGPPPGARKTLDEVLHGKTTAWGVGTRPLDTDTLVMFAIRDDADFVALLDRLVEVAPYLAPWRETATRFPGFALEEPLAGAVVLGASGQEEWDPQNEVVHRVGELALLRRFGRQPYWLLQGWAWLAELSVQRSVYCFPYRDGFVGVGEHSGWDRALRSAWAKSRDALAIEDIVALRRGEWDDRAAKHAWGAVSFFDRFHSADFPRLLEDFRAAWDKGSRRDLGAGRWERDPNYELPTAEQLAILQKYGGADVLGDLKRFFAQGSGPARAH